MDSWTIEFPGVVTEVSGAKVSFIYNACKISDGISIIILKIFYFINQAAEDS